MGSLHPTENQDTHDTMDTHNLGTIAIVSMISLATALITGKAMSITMVVSITVVITIMKRNQAKIKAALESSNRVEGITNDVIELMKMTYEQVPGPVNAIDTQDNIVYSPTTSSTATM